MSTNDTAALLESLDREQQRLRRQVRWLMLGLSLTLALLLVGEARRWLTPPQDGHKAPPGELRVSRLVLVDEAGRTRAELAMAPPPGAPEERRQATLMLHDEAGQARVVLGASARESGLMFYDAKAAPSLGMYMEPDFQGLVIFDGRAPRILLHYNQHDDLQLSELIFRDEQQRTQVQLSGGRGGSSLKLQGVDGERTFQAP